MNVIIKDVIKPKVIIHPKSIIGFISLKIKDKKANSNYSRLHFAWGNQWAVREEAWKLIGNKNNSNMSLHNLSDKKPEVINYAKDKPDIVKHLLSLHKSWAEDVSPKSND